MPNVNNIEEYDRVDRYSLTYETSYRFSNVLQKFVIKNYEIDCPGGSNCWKLFVK